MPTGLHNLKPAPGSTHRKKRIGRGIGSGHGKTSTRGHKGAKARGQVNPNLEGGQTPLHRRLPQLRGFKPVNKKQYALVNVDVLEKYFEAGAEISPEVMLATGLLRDIHDGLKILGNGQITKALTVYAHKFSKSAEDKIKAAGGEAILLPENTRPTGKSNTEFEGPRSDNAASIRQYTHGGHRNDTIEHSRFQHIDALPSNLETVPPNPEAQALSPSAAKHKSISPVAPERTVPQMKLRRSDQFDEHQQEDQFKENKPPSMMTITDTSRVAEALNNQMIRLDFDHTTFSFRYLKPFAGFEVAVCYRNQLALSGDIYPIDATVGHSHGYYMLSWPTCLDPIEFLLQAYEYRQQMQTIDSQPPKARKALAEGVYLVGHDKQLIDLDGEKRESAYPLEALHEVLLSNRQTSNAGHIDETLSDQLEAIHVGMQAADLFYVQGVSSQRATMSLTTRRSGLATHQENSTWLSEWLLRTHAATSDASEEEKSPWRHIAEACLHMFNHPQVWKEMQAP
jgi:large subunit ribosomal protein L15